MNVFVYARREDASEHDRYAAWLQALTTSDRLGLATLHPVPHGDYLLESSVRLRHTDQALTTHVRRELARGVENRLPGE